nr:hypothetical protein [Micromonospora sp. DSM 115978]
MQDISTAFTSPRFPPYDPTESPGPIGSAVERFRRGRPESPRPSEAEAEANRYTVLLVSPDEAEQLGEPRFDAGLRLFRDDDWEANISDLDEAVDIIERECGEPVSLVEHRSDLTYWTARVRD